MIPQFGAQRPLPLSHLRRLKRCVAMETPRKSKQIQSPSSTPNFKKQPGWNGSPKDLARVLERMSRLPDSSTLSLLPARFSQNAKTLQQQDASCDVSLSFRFRCILRCSVALHRLLIFMSMSTSTFCLPPFYVHLIILHGHAQVAALVKVDVFRRLLVDSQRLSVDLTFTKTALYASLKILGEDTFKLTGPKLNKFLAENVPDFLLFWRGGRKILRGEGSTKNMLVNAGAKPFTNATLSSDDDGDRRCAPARWISTHKT